MRPDHYFFEERCALMERADTLEDGLPDKQCNQREDLNPVTEFTAVDIKIGYWSKAKRGYNM